MKKALPEHVPMDQFKVIDNCLQVGHVAVDRLAERVGQTPFYAYDRQLMTCLLYTSPSPRD